jgi:hypothetical protein
MPSFDMTKLSDPNAFPDEVPSSTRSQSEEYNGENNPQGEERWDLFLGSKFHNPPVGILLYSPLTSLP